MTPSLFERPQTLLSHAGNAGFCGPYLEITMRLNRFCMHVVFAAAIVAIVATGLPAAAPPATKSAAKTPAHMGGLDPKGLGKPEEIVRRRWNAVLLVVRNPKTDQQTKRLHVEEIVTPVFDFRAMTRLALGSKNWRRFSAAQIKEFSALFVKRLKESYGRRIADYGGESVAFKPALPQKPSKSRKPTTRAGGPKIVHVPVEIVSKTSRWTILHKFRRIGDLYRIYDIEIEGVSILRSYRAQFNDVLSRGTPEDLLKRLRKPPPEKPKGGPRT